MGYMGHLTLVAEDVLSALEHYPFDLLVVIRQFVPQPDWDDYVSTRYQETKRKDTSLLGGGKPVVAPGAARGAQRWRVDEEDEPSGASLATLNGELRKTNIPTQMPKNTADFGISGPPDDDGSMGPAQVRTCSPSVYLPHHLHSLRHTSRRRCIRHGRTSTLQVLLMRRMMKTTGLGYRARQSTLALRSMVPSGARLLH